MTGVMAHPVGTLPSLTGAGAGLVLNLLAHTVGWPIPVGGSQAIADALALDVTRHGGELVTGSRIGTLAEVSGARAVLLDVAPTTFQAMARGRLTGPYRRALEAFTYGNATCKVDFILSGPVPWTHPDLRRAGTAHLGGTREEIVAGEKQVNQGVHPDSPYVLLSQPSSFDPTRSPGGRHTLWTYCHVPHGSTRDMAEAVTSQIERFAPGFRDVIVRTHTTTASDLEAYNANYVGGDFSGRSGEPAADRGPSGALHPTLGHAAAGCLPVLPIHAARSRRPRDGRFQRRETRPPAGIRPSGAGPRSLTRSTPDVTTGRFV